MPPTSAHPAPIIDGPLSNNTSASSSDRQPPSDSSSDPANDTKPESSVYSYVLNIDDDDDSHSSWSLDSSGEPIIYVPANSYSESAEHLPSLNRTKVIYYENGSGRLLRQEKTGAFTLVDEVEVVFRKDKPEIYIHYSAEAKTSIGPEMQTTIRTNEGNKRVARSVVSEAPRDRPPNLYEAQNSVEVKVRKEGIYKDYYRPLMARKFAEEFDTTGTNLGPAYGTNEDHCKDCRRRTRLKCNQGFCLCPIGQKK